MRSSTINTIGIELHGGLGDFDSIHDRIQGIKRYNTSNPAFIKSVVYRIPTLHVMFDEVGTTVKTPGAS